MDTQMSHVATARRFTAVLAQFIGLAAATVSAQTTGGLDWRRLGQPAIDMHLAGTASGPVAAVWYAADGNRLYARMPLGQVFETLDFEHWSRSEATRPDGQSAATTFFRLPEPQARVVTLAGDPRRAWALGRNLFVSEDSGASWVNVTGQGTDSIIGPGQTDVAVDPRDPSSIAVANSFGIWQTRDSGQSWTGLNDNLPNLPVARILSTQRGNVKVILRDGRTVHLTEARAPWMPAGSENILASEARERQRAGKTFNTEISALARVGEYMYAGAADGRIWVSRDRGTTWALSQVTVRGSVERFYVDPDAPRAALGMISGWSQRLIRTVNGGAVWDDVTGNLGDAIVNAATADRTSSTAYIATDRGVYTARVDLNAFTPATSWTLVSSSLPKARAVDLALDAAAGQLFVALDGYGIYTAPVRSGPLRLTNAADFSNRPAAPGSVISVVGGKVTGARVGDLKFPVLASAEHESQLQVPFETRASSVDLAIEVNATTSVLPLAVRSVSPAIFVDRDGAPFLVDADTGLTFDSAAAAHPRTRLQLMATGLGRVQPDWPTGVPAPMEHPPAVVATVQAYLDGIPLEVTKAVLAPGYVGSYLIEVQLPAVLNAGPAQLYVSADGQESNRVRVLVDAQ